MSEGMEKAHYIERAKECAALLRKIADCEILGDGTLETWACGISANLLGDLIEYKEKEAAGKKTLVEALKEIAAAISENGGADVKMAVKQTSSVEYEARIIIEPYRYIFRG